MPRTILSTILVTALLSASATFGQSSAKDDPNVILPFIGDLTGEHLKLVTVQHPSRSQNCHVESIAKGLLTCSRPFGLRPAVFRQPDVVALIRPATSHGRPWRDFAFCESIAGGILTGAVFLGRVAFPVGLIGAIPLGLVGVTAVGACGMVFDDGTASSYTRLQVLYLKHGEQLQANVKH